MNKGFSKDKEILQQEEGKKRVVEGMVKDSKAFEKIAIKRGLIEGTEIESKEQGEE